MALVVEDGTGVANANTYASVAEAKAFAGLRGATLPSADTDIEILLIKAMDFLEAQSSRFQGSRTHTTQLLSFPRTGVTIDNLSVDANAIPSELKYAQIQLAIEANTTDLQPTRQSGASGPVTRKKVDTIEIEYSSEKARGFTPAFAKADAHLSKLFVRGGLSLVRT